MNQDKVVRCWKRRREAACVSKPRTKPDARGRAEDGEGDNTGEAKRRQTWRRRRVENGGGAAGVCWPGSDEA